MPRQLALVGLHPLDGPGTNCANQPGRADLRTARSRRLVVNGEAGVAEAEEEAGWNVYSRFVDIALGATATFEVSLAAAVARPDGERITWLQPVGSRCAPSVRPPANDPPRARRVHGQPLPLAERAGVLQHRLAGCRDVDGEMWTIRSAGTSTVVALPDPLTIAAAKCNGVDLSGHVARHLDREILTRDGADLVLTMTRAPASRRGARPGVVAADVHAEGAGAPGRARWPGPTIRRIRGVAPARPRRKAGGRHDRPRPA